MQKKSQPSSYIWKTKVLSLGLAAFMATLTFLGSAGGTAAASPTPTPAPGAKATPTPKPGNDAEAASEATPGAALDEKSQRVLENLDRLTREQDQNETLKDIYADMNVKKRGYVAQVLSMKDKTVKVKTLDGIEQFLTLDKSTTLLRQGKETTADTVEISDWMNVDDWLVVIGVEQDDAFAPRRVLISSVDLLPKTKVVKTGNIAAINKSKISYTPVGDTTVREMIINKNTLLEDNAGETVKIADLEVGAPILVVGVSGTAGDTARTIRLLPGAMATTAAQTAQ